MMDPNIHGQLEKLGYNLSKRILGQQAEICAINLFYDMFIFLAQEDGHNIVSIKNTESMMPPRTNDATHQTLMRGCYGHHIDHYIQKYIGLDQLKELAKEVVSNPGEVENVFRAVLCWGRAVLVHLLLQYPILEKYTP
jgi:hypothetical protein